MISKTHTKIWYHWFNIRIRQYMILETFFFISLIMIFYRLQTIYNQTERVLETVNSMQSQFGSMERKIELSFSRKPNQDISQFESIVPLEQSIADVLNSMDIPTKDSTEIMEPIVPQVKQKLSEEKSTVDDPKKMKFPTQDDTDDIEPTTSQTSHAVSETKESTFEVSESEKQYRFNAADFLRGAFVDSARSSSSNLKPLIGYDQSNLVILDRPQPPADKAWCTNDENPVLTINLVEFIEPISVSYQHSKWNVTIPDGAPKTYDVVACFDYYCKTWKPLVSNCKYSQNKEQMCNIHLLNVPLIRTVQFRFRENYGDTKMTCVHLVRVYGETKTPAKIKEKNLDSEKICADLKQNYHNSYFHKYFLRKKSCTVLYENDCCSECPECCQECLISDYNFGTLSSIFSHIILIFIIFGVFALLMSAA
ncbi:unnamed protein product [Caenorhabditis nigoni]